MNNTSSKTKNSYAEYKILPLQLSYYRLAMSLLKKVLGWIMGERTLLLKVISRHNGLLMM